MTIGVGCVAPTREQLEPAVNARLKAIASFPEEWDRVEVEHGSMEKSGRPRLWVSWKRRPNTLIAQCLDESNGGDEHVRAACLPLLASERERLGQGRQRAEQAERQDAVDYQSDRIAEAEAERAKRVAIFQAISGFGRALQDSAKTPETGSEPLEMTCKQDPLRDDRLRCKQR